MRNKLYAALLTLCLATTAGAQGGDVEIRGMVSGFSAAEAQLHLQTLGYSDRDTTVRCVATDSQFVATMPAAESGFYVLYGRMDGQQLVVPLYHPDLTKSMRIVAGNEGIVANYDDDNRALSATARLLRDTGRRLFDNRPTDSDNRADSQRQALLQNLLGDAESIATQGNISPAVVEYIRLWTFTTAVNMGLKAEDTAARIDTRGAMLFKAAATQIVSATLPKTDINGRLDYLYANYRCEPLRRLVAGRLVERFISRFNAAKQDYNQGLVTVQGIVEKYQLDPQLAETFKARKVMTTGMPFPEKAELCDLNGNTMHFSQWKGKYVYVDLWASWCKPCINEIPALQQLEKDFEDSDIVFLSISIDSDTDKWKRKVEELSLYGNQWISTDKALTDALDVQSIPRFLLFDKLGKLLNGDTTRPSNPQTKEMLSNLK